MLLLVELSSATFHSGAESFVLHRSVLLITFYKAPRIYLTLVVLINATIHPAYAEIIHPNAPSR